MGNENQEKRARKHCGKLYRKLLNGCDLTLDDEKYFKLSGDNIGDNRFFYSTDPATAPPNIKFPKKQKFEAKIMIWMAISSKDVSDVYVHRSKQAIRQTTYLDECINKRTLPSIENIIEMEIISSDQIWQMLIVQMPFRNVWMKNMCHLFAVKVILPTYFMLVQSNPFGFCLNAKYMKLIGKPKIWID